MAEVNGRAQYRRGTDFERRTARALMMAGYFTVRSGGSRGSADIVALKIGQQLLVQCKRDGRMTVGEWNLLYAAAITHGAIPVLAAQDGRRRVYWRITGQRKAYQRADAWPREELHIDLEGL